MATSSLTDPRLLIVIAHAPAGLGHLRVADALYHGLPPGVTAVILGSQDKAMTWLHRFASVHTAARAIFEWLQYGWREDIFTGVYRSLLRSHTKLLEAQLAALLAERRDAPTTILVIATYMGLAHQLAAMKERFEKNHHVRLVIVVVVTDDAPLKIWAVPGADLIVVPSGSTKQRLEAYHQTLHPVSSTTYTVAPYPVAPMLAEALPLQLVGQRKAQLDSASATAIHVAIPVSGAAVQLSYFSHYMDALKKASDRFTFHIVSKEMLSTRSFLADMVGRPNVTVASSPTDQEAVDLYEKLYAKETIGLEVTKPSEQAFKALVDPTKRGGSILLLTDPVGRQEWDNLAFLQRHGLVPKHAGSKRRWEFAEGASLPDSEMLADARHWRGLRLPSDPKQAAAFTLWCLRYGIFAAMADFSGYPKHPELASDGVARFWERVEAYLRP
ncbi:hypothetical protein HY950_02605 [Candidatus Gottesmanbacteria bacterium]|nr:hypothetical protein [Candidatus Gottesmanbacteria bacterium]